MKKGQMMTALEGSPINCAPEMIKGEGYSFPRDWWSVGIMIYQMIGESFFLFDYSKNFYKKVFRHSFKTNVVSEMAHLRGSCDFSSV